MPITVPSIPSPESLPATNSPSVGDIPSYASDGTYTWVPNAGGSADTKLVNFITDIKRRGFVDLTETTITLTGDDKDTVNLNMVGVSWSYYLAGEKHTITASKSVALPDTPATRLTTKYYIYMNTTDGTLKVKETVFDLINECPVAVVIWSSDRPAGSQSSFSDERHQALWDASVHRYAHLAFSTQKISGGVLSGVVEDSDVDANKQPDISQSVIADEDLFLTLNALVGGAGKYSVMFRTGSDVWSWETGLDFPFRHTTSGRMNYDDGSLAGAEIDSGKFVNIYHLLTDLDGDLRHVWITSQNQYDTIEEAYSKSFKDLTLTGLLVPEYFVNYKITVRVSDDYSSTGKCVFKRVSAYGGNPTDLAPESIGSPVLVSPSVVDDIVVFASTTGGQKDGGKKISDLQPIDATLTSLAALGTGADKFAYTTGVDTWAESAITAAGRAILDDANSAAQLVTLGALPVAGGTMTGPLEFSGTTNSGIKVNSLTTVQRDALTPANGMIIWNTTTSRFNFYSGSSWFEMVRLSGDTMEGRLVTAPSAAVAGAGLNIPAGPAPNSAAEGDIWFDSTQKCFSTYLAGLKLNLGGTAYNKTNVTTITASTSTNEENLYGTGIGTVTIPANMLVAGKTLRIKASGIFTTSANSATYVIRIKFGSTVLATTGTINPANNLTNQMWTIDGEFVTKTTGATGTIRGNAIFTFASSATAFSMVPLLNSADVTIDTTAASIFTPVIQYSENTAGNTFSCTNYSLEVLS